MRPSIRHSIRRDGVAAMQRLSARTVLAVLVLLLCMSGVTVQAVGGAAADSPGSSAPAGVSGGEKQGESLKEVNKQLTNPISNVWSLTVEQDNYLLNNPHAWNSELQFQPILPVALTKDWNLVTRPVFKVFNSTPYVNSEGNSARDTGLGDSTLAMVLSPNTSNWLLGLGPTFTLPTASTQQTGQGKWQAGPAAVFGYLSESFLLALYSQQWWSFAGQSDRSETNKLQLQYFASYFWGDGWAIGMSPNILVNWEASSGQKLTFPVGLSLSKVVNVCGVPVKFGIQGQYMAIRPDNSGQEWNIQFQITPRLPPLIQGALF